MKYCTNQTKYRWFINNNNNKKKQKEMEVVEII